MKYFLHDSNAFSDEKITLLYLEFGFEAIGLFFTILEKLALQEQPLNEIVLKSQLNIKKRLEKQLSFMYKIGILSLRNGDVFNENLLKNSEKYQIKKEKTKKRVSQWRENQTDKKNVTRYKRVRNTPKDKISKDNIVNYKQRLLSELKNSDFENEKQIEYFEITKAFYDLFKKNLEDSGASITTLEKSKGKWIDSIRLLIENDKNTIDSIRIVFGFLQHDEFWKVNILSTSKLRQQFNKLLMKANSNGKTGQSTTTPKTTNEQLANILHEKFNFDS